MAVRKPQEHKARKLHTYSHIQMEAGLYLQARDFFEVKANKVSEAKAKGPPFQPERLSSRILYQKPLSLL